MDLDPYPERHFVPDYDEATEESNGSDHNVTDSSSASAPKHKRKRWRKKECVICGFQDTHPGRHITRVHLPWWLKTKTACSTCRVQEGHVTFMRKHHHESDSYNETRWIHWAVGMVCIIQKDLQLSSCEALRQFVIGNKLYTKNGKFDSEEQLVLAKLSAQLGETIPEDSVTACPPNCTAGLLHWETLAKIIPRMSNQSVIHPQLEPNLPDTLTVNPGNYNTLPGILDSHAHIDQLLFKNKCYSIKQFARENINHAIRIKGIVSNFVHPYRWLDHSHICEDPRIKPSFGIHPRFISTRHSVYKNLNLSIGIVSLVQSMNLQPGCKLCPIVILASQNL